MTILKRAALALAATAAITTAAQAGGFSRGSANLDGLYASEYVNEPIISSFGVTFVSPGRSYDSVTGIVPTGQVVVNPATGAPVINPATGQPVVQGTGVPFQQGDTEFGQDFAVPFASLGLKFAERGQCVGSYAQPYGADSSYDGPVSFYIQSQSIETFELGATCSVGFDAGRGRAYAIGGVFYESLEYDQARDFRALDAATVAGIGAGAISPTTIPPGRFFGATGVSQISVSDQTVGFRLGAAYEIPEIALKASLIYRSETEYDDISGTFTGTPFAGIFRGRAGALAAQARQAGLAGNADLAQRLAAAAAQQNGFSLAAGTSQSSTATGVATLPRQLELNVQSGVAAGTLVFGSLKWTDWSVVQQIDLVDQFSGAAFTNFQGFFRDGYTATLGVGRAFNEDLAGSLSLTYDRGVGTGFDTFSDTYTVAGGVAYDLNEIANVRAGGAVIYFTEDEKTQGDFLATSPGEFGYALSTSLNIKF